MSSSDFVVGEDSTSRGVMANVECDDREAYDCGDIRDELLQCAP